MKLIVTHFYEVITYYLNKINIKNANT